MSAWRIREPEPVLDVSLVLTDLLRELSHRVAECIGHLAEHGRLLERRDILALEVLDDADLEGRALIEVDDDRRDRLAFGHPRRAPAALTSDQLELRAARPHEDGLQNTVLANRVGQLRQ